MKDFARIIDEVAAETKIPSAIIMGRGQRQELVAARDLAIYRIYTECPYVTQRCLAKYFHREHTGMGVAIRKVRKRMEAPLNV